MIDRRLLLLGFLIALPFWVCIGFGAHALFVTGYWKYLWWILPCCWALAWLISRLSTERSARVDTDRLELPRHSTAADVEAAEIVLRHQQRVRGLDPARLKASQFYLDEVQELASALARHYHGQEDPTKVIDSLTIVEVVAAIRLAIDDVESWITESAPGSSWLTVGQWRKLTKTPAWVNTGSNAIWLGSVLINPANLLRYGTSQVFLKPVTRQLQTEVVATLYLRFIRQVGFYLIEMYSGRLRGGAAAYNQAFSPTREVAKATASGAKNAEPMEVTVAVLGQTSSGKSSLINALLSQECASTDLLPQTRSTQRFRWTLDQEGIVELSILDTPGYGDVGATKTVQREIMAAVHEADLILLVMDGHVPGRSADTKLLKELHQRLESDQQRKSPPIIGVLTHVDLLPPASLWEPPYDIEAPTDAKSENIREAIQYVVEVCGKQVAAVVPVCLAEPSERRWGVDQFLLPEIIDKLDEAKAVAALRALQLGLNQSRFRTVAKQVGSLAGAALTAWLEERGQSGHSFTR